MMELTVINEREQTYHTYTGVFEVYISDYNQDVSFSAKDEITGETFDISISADKYTSIRFTKG